jgi:hypothetical protein
MTTVENPTVENPWRVHVKAFRERNPGFSYKAALEHAGQEVDQDGNLVYQKAVKAVRDPNAVKKPNPWMLHVEKYKEDNPKWKSRMTYKEVLLICKDTYAEEKAKALAMQ